MRPRSSIGAAPAAWTELVHELWLRSQWERRSGSRGGSSANLEHWARIAWQVCPRCCSGAAPSGFQQFYFVELIIAPTGAPW
jgi:hypothetical protein